jgi:hypothetical protein
MPALSPVKKESVGLGAVEWVQKKNCKSGKTVFMGILRKKKRKRKNILLFRNIFS